MSETEKFWVAVAAKFGDNRQWHQLQPQEQHQVIMGINMILSVVAR
jgi:hypothetical protein